MSGSAGAGEQILATDSSGGGERGERDSDTDFARFGDLRWKNPLA